MATPSVSSSTQLPKLSVAACLLKYLTLEGVDLLFGVPGGALTHILNELKNDQHLRYIICRHETGAVYLADGYARATGKLGVALVTAGPGATNALTGTMNAQNSNTNVLTITGEVPETTWGLGYLQEGIDANLNIDAIYRNASQYSAVITAAANFQPLFTQALRDALSLPPRAAHVSLPDDVAGQCLEAVPFPSSPENYRATPRCSDVPATQTVLELLAAAKRPLLLLGNGCRRALADADRRDQLVAFAERFALPVMTTPEAKGLFPEAHALALCSYGLAGCTWPRYYMQARKGARHDLLLVVGSSLQQLATNGWNEALIPDGPFVQVDLDQSVIARAFHVSHGIVAEIGVFLDDLTRLGAEVPPDPKLVKARSDLLRQIKQKHSRYLEPDKRNSDATPILPQALMRCINDGLVKAKSRDPMIFLDGGNCLGWGYHYLEINPPAEIHSALDMGPMGFGVGAVIGARLGRPERDCVAIVGDGALLMFGAEISSAAEYKVGAVWVVLFDNDLAMASQGMNYYFPDPTWAHYYRLGNPDLAKFARSLGADGYDVHSPEEMLRTFPRALRRARTHGKPQVVVAHINRDEMPPYHPVPAPVYVPCDQR
jgi:acetolactate synthase-1/2/3 large subunit